MRYTSSMFVATILSLFTFLGMSLLIANPSYKKTTNIEMVDFSKINDIKQPTVKTPVKKPPPQKTQVQKPPAAPPLDITRDSGRPKIAITDSTYKKSFFDAPKFTSPNIGPQSKEVFNNGGSDLIQLLAIQPVYPQKELRNKTEGWVKVEITVNKFGNVSHAKVIDSHPKRVFNSATFNAMYKSKFKPMVINGKAVTQKAIQIIEFKINN